MKYELTQEEFSHIECYRNLFPEFQAALDKQMSVLHELQTEVIKEALSEPS